MGADVLLYPTTIGSEPQDPTLDSSDHWQRVMQGHSAANVIPIVACNRFGTEVLMNQQGEEVQRNHYYGRSFITDVKGAIVKEAKNGSDIISCEIDIEANRDIRTSWGIFRDRRPELYNPLLTKDGHTRL
jgi:N-carbamoylputrescine amidase